MNVLNRVRSLAVVPLLLIPFATAVGQGAAQTGTIAGKVVDEKGAPIAGAQIGDRGDDGGTQTGTSGTVRARASARGHPGGPGANGRIPA